jgi:hypothetical protein
VAEVPRLHRNECTGSVLVKCRCGAGLGRYRGGDAPEAAVPHLRGALYDTAACPIRRCGARIARHDARGGWGGRPAEWSGCRAARDARCCLGSMRRPPSIREALAPMPCSLRLASLRPPHSPGRIAPPREMRDSVRLSLHARLALFNSLVRLSMHACTTCIIRHPCILSMHARPDAPTPHPPRPHACTTGALRGEVLARRVPR